MTSLHTHPIPRPDVARGHAHGWITESQLATSEGLVAYVRCADCGARRVDLRRSAARPPEAMTGVVEAR